MTVSNLTENFIGTIYVFEDNFLSEPHAIIETDSPVLDLLASKEVKSWTVRCHSKKPMINVAIDMNVEATEDTDDSPVEDSDETLDTDNTESATDSTTEGE